MTLEVVYPAGTCHHRISTSAMPIAREFLRQLAAFWWNNPSRKEEQAAVSRSDPWRRSV